MARFTEIYDSRGAYGGVSYRGHDHCHGVIGLYQNEKEYLLCHKCGAFTFNLDSDFPKGTDKAANRAAWDDGQDQSPDENNDE